MRAGARCEKGPVRSVPRQVFVGPQAQSVPTK